jgi:hypothetical protein
MSNQSQPTQLIPEELKLGDMFRIKTINEKNNRTTSWFLIVMSESSFPSHAGGKTALFHKEGSDHQFEIVAFIPQKRTFEVGAYLFVPAMSFETADAKPAFYHGEERIISIQRLRVVLAEESASTEARSQELP